MDIRALLVRVLLLGAVFPPALGRAAPPALTAAALPNPARAGATQAALATAGDGSIWLAWLEPVSAGGAAVRCARFDPVRGRWQTAVTVARGDGFVQEPANLPAFAASGKGQAAVAWTVLADGGQAERVMLSQSQDGGYSWSPPSPLSAESRDAASPALATLGDGRLVAAWLDRRGRRPDGSGLRLSVRLLGAGATPDRLLDPEAVEGCQPTISPLLDGGALVAYRGRHPGAAARPRLVRWHRQQWGEPHDIDSDPDDGGDQPDGGPRVAVDGGRVGAVWAADGGGEARLLVSASPDAGIRFQMPVSAGIGEDGPSRPALALLHDGALLVAWWDGARPEGSHHLRLGRFSPDLRPLPAAVTLAATGPITTPPQIALVRDYAGNAATAEALLAFVAGGPTPALQILKLTVPEGALLAAANDDCRCSPTPAQLAGYPIRGTITDLQVQAGRLTLDIDAAPGVMDAGAQVFTAAAGTLAAAQVGRQCLARIERQAGGWQLFDLRLLEEPH